MAIATSSLHKLQLPALADRLERLRVTGRVSHQEWFDLLGVPWLEYQEFKMGRASFELGVFERVAGRFGLRVDDLLTDRIDFQDLAMKVDASSELPEAYSRAAYGRRRTSITSIEFLEKHQGWRLRSDALRALKVPEGALQDPFAPISVRFLSDLCLYLARRQFRKEDFFRMGLYTFDGNKDSMLGRFFSQIGSLRELYSVFLVDMMKVFEQNCRYTIIRMDDDGLTVEAVTNPDVGAELSVRHIGNEALCSLKAGHLASMPLYLGLRRADVTETCCVHRGDSVCRFEVDFPGTHGSP